MTRRRFLKIAGVTGVALGVTALSKTPKSITTFEERWQLPDVDEDIWIPIRPWTTDLERRIAADGFRKQANAPRLGVV